MIDSQLTSPVEIGSEKNFGIVFGVVFIIIGILPLWGGGPVRAWAFIIAFFFFLLAYFFPKILKVPNRIWFKLGMFLGDIIAPVMMALIYFVAVVPTGIYARFAGKDILGKRRDQSTSTYWINRDDPAGTMKNQF